MNISAGDDLPPSVPVAALRDIEEMKLLRQEMQLYHTQNFQTEVFGMGAVFAFYAWISSVTVSGVSAELAATLLTVPPVIAVLAVISRLHSYRRRMARLALYLSMVEQRMSLDPGWENFLRISRGLTEPKSYNYPEKAGDTAKHDIETDVTNLTGRLFATWRERFFTWWLMLAFSLLIFVLSLFDRSLVSINP